MDENTNIENEEIIETTPDETDVETDDIENEFSIPDEYKEKGWTKFFGDKKGDELKEALFKAYDNSQNLIGKKVGEYLNTVDFKNLENYEEIKSKIAGFDVPENVEDYNIKELFEDENGNQILPIADETSNQLQDFFKEQGLSTTQAKDIVNKYIELTKADFDAVTNSDELEKNINSMFGGNLKERNSCESLIKEFLPKEDLQMLSNYMPNQVIEMFYKIAKGMVNKYGFSENSNAIGKSNIGLSKAEKDAEYNRVTEELINLSRRSHSVEEKEALMERLNNIYK